MKAFVLRHPQGIRIQTLAEYQEYCYYVAGTVGYMLTDLWRASYRAITPGVYDALRTKARAFGEALQTVNILKDVAVDAERENSIYIPEELLRAQGSSHATLLDPAHETANHTALTELIRLAWANLDAARDYLLLVPRRALAVRLFCILPLLFAYATLRDLTRSRAMLRREREREDHARRGAAADGARTPARRLQCRRPLARAARARMTPTTVTAAIPFMIRPVRAVD